MKKQLSLLKRPLVKRNNGHSKARFRGRSASMSASAGLRVETLEDRLMLSGDPLSNYILSDSALKDAGTSTVDQAPVSDELGLSSDLGAEGENTPETDLVGFAKALAATEGVKLFGTAWCTACTAQKELFEDGGQFLPFIEVTEDIAEAEDITGYPTWEFPDGSREEGMLSLETIASRAGVSIPTSAQPFVAPVEDQTVLDGSPLHVGLDGYDPNGGPLTFTVTSSDPSVVQPTVLSGNRSAAIRFTDWGEIVVELFEQRVPRAAGRFITLAESGFYDAAENDPDVTVHRVIDDFMFQFGDPTGTGAGGSSLGDFDDQFHPDLQHNTPGMISWAKSDDDTNDSQVFMIDVPTRYLDFNHSVFGMLTEGEKIRDDITKTATDGNDRPEIPIKIDSVTVLEDSENGVVMLKAAEDATGSATITVTVTDEDGNSYIETFDVTVESDTFNGGPYLEEIDPVSAVAGDPTVFQLSSVDVEGDDVTYGGVKRGTVDYTLDVDSQTGTVTVTPPSDYAGELEALVYVRPATTSDTSDVYDTQTVTISVAPAAPQHVDLLPAADSGVSDTDNVTNVATLEFRVDGVSDGAVVRLYHEDTVLGQTTASGTSATISTSSLAGLGDGTYSVHATQANDGLESPASAAFDVTLDTTAPPDFTSTPPALATSGELLSYDAENPEEGTAGTTYSLIDAPQNVSVDAVSGLLSWTPAETDIGTHQFSIAITDAAGNSRSQEINLEVRSAPVVTFRLETTDQSGVPISTAAVGDTFDLRVYVEDVSADPHGIFAAFIDLLYDQALVATDGELEYGASYPNNRVGDLSVPGLVDEVGAVAGTEELGGDEYLLFSLPMQAIHAGTAGFESEAADQLPAHELLRFDGDFNVDPDEVGYGSTSLLIEPSFGANDDIFNLDEDSGLTSLDVLANDEAFEGSTGEFTIVDVTATSQGGTANIAADGKSIEYTPAADFFGEETFTYTVSDSTGTDTAAVTVQVMPQNDDPTANDDEFVVMEDTVEFVMDVLSNDSIDPDEDESLSIVGFDSLSSGGTLSITPEEDRLLYSPAPNFFGTETFNYTIDDGNGGTDTAAVTVTVTEVNDPPEANDDLFEAIEDSTDNVLDVLANDTTAGDTGETLKIVDVVSAPDQGGTVTISEDELTLIYTPENDFFGDESFTYQITDGNGGFAEATVTVAVSGTNDPPTANDDTVTVVKETSDNLLEVLENDTSAPDADETLTITTVGSPSAGGTATVAEDGLGILYSPPAEFTGEETFSYTIEDPDGATSQATVTVTVLDYIPSTLSGYAYLDVDNDGVKDTEETPLGGVVITLQGTDMFGDAVELRQTTNALGHYQFVDLVPGNYDVVQTQPRFLIDGIDTAGDVSYAAGTDSLPIELEQDADITGFNFGERGREPSQITIVDFFASRARTSVLAAAGSDDGDHWYAIEGGWSRTESLSMALDADGTTAELDITTTDQQQYSMTLDMTSGEQVQMLQGNGESNLLRVLRSPDLVPVDTDGGCSGDGGSCAPPESEAEGEPLTVIAAGADAEGESAVIAGTGQFDAAVASPSISQPAISAIPPTRPVGVADDGEGESASVSVLMPATPANAHLATDQLMAEPAELLPSAGPSPHLQTSPHETNDDFLEALDLLMSDPETSELLEW